MARSENLSGIYPDVQKLPLRKPKAPEAPRLSHFPKIPHVSHGRVILLIAGALAAVGVAANITVEHRQRPPSNTVPGEKDDIMSYPYGETLNLFIDSSGDTVIKFNRDEPQVLKAVSFNVGEDEKVLFVNNNPDNPQRLRVDTVNLVNDYFVPFFGEGDRQFILAVDNIPVGDIWLMRVNENGEPLGFGGEVLSEKDFPIYTRIDNVKLDLPQITQ